jgi:hypothetical protein
MSRFLLRELVVPLIAVAIAASYVWQTLGYPADAIVLPYVVIGLMVMLLAVVILQAVRGAAGVDGKKEAKGAPVSRRRAEDLRAPLLVVLTLAYIGGMGVVGFFLATAGYLAITMWLLGNARPLIYIPVALATAAGVSLALDRLLNISLPTFPYVRLPLGF